MSTDIKSFLQNIVGWSPAKIATFNLDLLDTFADQIGKFHKLSKNSRNRLIVSIETLHGNTDNRRSHVVDVDALQRGRKQKDQEKITSFLTEVEGLRDTFSGSDFVYPKTFVLKKFVASWNLKPRHKPDICNFLNRYATELKETLEGEDSFLKEAYACYTRPQLKKLLGFYVDFLETLQEGASQSPVTKENTPKVRKNRNTTQGKVIKSIGNNNFGKNVLCVVVFNPTYKKFSLYQSIRGMFLEPHMGKSLKNVALHLEKSSRNPDEVRQLLRKAKSPEDAQQVFSKFKGAESGWGAEKANVQLPSDIEIIKIFYREADSFDLTKV